MESGEMIEISFGEMDPLCLDTDEIEIKDEPCDDTDSVAVTSNVFNPMAYTTRLEDMYIFNQGLVGLTIKEITDCIELESKPNPVNTTKQRKRHRNKTDYNRVVTKLKEINEVALNTFENTIVTVKDEHDEENQTSNLNSFENIVTVEDENGGENKKTNLSTVENTIVNVKDKDDENIRKINKELLSMCKPVRIVLERVKVPLKNGMDTNCLVARGIEMTSIPLALPTKMVKKKIPRHPPPTTSVSIPPPTTSVSTQTKIEVQEITKLEDLSPKDRVNKLCLRKSVVLFVEKNSNDVDGYYLDWQGQVADILKLDVMSNYESLVRQTGTNKLFKILCCCWFKREEIIKDLWVKLIPIPTAKFMRKLHKCVPGDCKCCCRNKNNSADETLTTIVVNIEKPLKPSSPNIKEAHSRVTEPGTLHGDFLDITNTAHFRDKSYWLQELMRNNNASTLINKALRYTRPKCQEISAKPVCNTPVDLLYLNNDKKNEIDCYELAENGKVVTYLCERQKCSRFNISVQCAALKKASASYIKRTLAEKTCCWFKLEKDILASTEKLEVPINALTFLRKPHTCPIGNCSCCCNPKKKNKPPPLSRISLPEHGRYVFNVTQTKEPKMLPEIKQITTAITTTDFTVTKNISTYTVPIEVEPDIKTRQPVNTAVQQQNMTKPDITANSTEKTVVNSLITTILDRFQDVRLTINSDGKVAAALSTPVSNLSTAELKVLANILSHAQEQVKVLGLRPGANLNQHVNLNQNILHTIQSNNFIPTPPPLRPIVNTTNPGNILSNQALVNNPFVRTSNINTNFSRIPQNFVPVSVANINTAPISYSNNQQNGIYKSLSNLMYQKNQCFNKSFQSHAKIVAEPSQNSIPRIENVFSLQGVSGSKRKSTDNQSLNKNKIRVVSPTKLGAATTDTQSLVLGNVSQVPQFQMNSSVAGSIINQPVGIPTIMVDTGNIQLMPQTNMLQHMLVHGTNLIKPNIIQAFPQPSPMNTSSILLPQTISVSSAVSTAQIQFHQPLSVMSTTNLLHSTNPQTTQILPGSVINQPGTQNSKTEQCNEMSTLRNCRPLSSKETKTTVTDPIKTDTDESSESRANSEENMITDDDIIKDEIKEEEEEEGDCVCILGV